ncbi:hypothetical protein RB594_001571 [Gaeumannomyces avenae]
MSFAIEAPGEATPLSLQELCTKLELASCSTDQTQRLAADQQLKAWETYPDFYPHLQTIYLEKSINRQARFLAIILLKNGIDKFWRNISTKSTIRPEQKNIIRSRLLQGCVEEDDKGLAVQSALAAAKVVRIDYPAEWPSAFADMVGFVRAFKTGRQAQLAATLRVLLRAVKELATARLRKSQTALRDATPELVQLLGEVYSEQVAYWLEFLTRGRGDEDAADYAMENSLFCLRTLRPLVIVGYDSPHREQLVVEFWNITQNQFGQFLGLVSHDSAVPAPYQETVGKHLVQFTKLHLEVCESLPTSFALLPNSIQLVHAYWDLVAKFAEVFDKSGGKPSGDDGSGASKSKVEGPLLEKLTLKGLLLLRNCISMVFKPQQTFKYRSAEFLKEQEQAQETVKTQLLTDQFVAQIVDVVITKLFVFRKTDLEAWEEDPEAWEAQERDSGDAWQFEVRPCAERVFLDLLVHYKQMLGPPLLNYFQTSAQAGSDIVAKEAVYTAMGCAAPTVYEVFDFDSFVTSTLVQDVQLQGDLAKLLRRRIAILLSQWVPIKMTDATRPTVFEIYRHLMNPEDERHNDLVVRITAARQLKKIADDFEFKPEIFQPYAFEILTRLVSLLTELTQDESKLAVLDTIRVLVSRMDSSARQVGDALMETLPKLWAEAGEESYMLKQSILAILSTLVNSVGADSQRYHPFMVPLIAQAMDPSSEIHKFLVDEATEVWKATMTQSSPPVSPELMALELVGLPFISFDSPLSQELVHIVKSYILLAPEGILGDQYRRPTLTALRLAVESKNKDQVHHAVQALDYMLRAAQELGGSVGLTVLVKEMLEIGLLQLVLEGLHDAWECHQTTGPQRRNPKLSPLKEAHYLSLLARITLGEPQALVHLMSVAGDVASVWAWLSAEWFESFDMMADAERQKLSCLALTRLCELAAAGPGAPPGLLELVLSKLQDYFSMWTMVVTEVQGGDASAADTLVWEGSPESNASEFDTPQDVRERAFAWRDQIRKEHTFNFIKPRLQALVQATGGEAAFESQWAVNVDRDVLAGFQRLSTPGGGQA